MEEHLADAALAASNALHWLGQHRIGNALVYLSRLCRALNLRTIDDLQDFVEEEEAAAQSDAEQMPGKPEGGG